MSQDNYFDLVENSGGGTTYQKRVRRGNPGEFALSMTPKDFGLLGWTVDQSDVASVAQAVVSGTQYFVPISVPFDTSTQIGNTVTKVGLHLGTTAPATPGTYTGMALYSWTLGGATMTKLSDTGADAGAAWVTSGASNYVEQSLTTAQNNASGLFVLSFIATFTTPPTVLASGTIEPLKIKGKSISPAYSLAAQTSFAASVTVSGLTALTWKPLMGIANA